MKSHKHLTIADYEAICALWEAVGLPFKPYGRDSKEAFAEQLGSGILTLFGYYNEDQLVGVAMASHDSRKGWINRIAVHPDYQRHGIATQLIQACEEHFASLGIHVWAALVESNNTNSLALFQNAGYHLHQDIYYLSRREHPDA